LGGPAVVRSVAVLPLDRTIASSLAPDVAPGANVCSAPAPVAWRPRFEPPFPWCDPGVVWGRGTLPAFGLWRGTPWGLRRALARHVTRCDHAIENDRVVLAVELETATGERMTIAHLPEAPSLGAALDRIQTSTRRLFSGGLGRGDLFRVPVLKASGGNDLRVSIDLSTEGPEQAPDARRILGRGEMYRRYFAADRRFFLVVRGAGSDLVLAAHLSPTETRGRA